MIHKVPSNWRFGEKGMAQGRKTPIDRDLHTSAELQARAHAKLPALTIERMLAIANALDGTTFYEAERAAGIER